MMNLILGDCLDKMKDIPDKSIDMVLTDPPYGTTACKWDTVIPFEPMWTELKRITKDNGAICLFGSEPFSSALRMSNAKNFRYDWIWKKQKPTGFLQARKMPLRSHEIISVFYFKLPNYFPQGLIPVHIKSGRKNKSANGVYNQCKGVDYIQKEGNFPRSIIEFDTDTSNPHPTAKPVALLEYLIKTYTLENETVLDFTMGSGSTGVACKNLNRKFIGIEQDEKYYEIARQRILGEQNSNQGS